jgi:CDP-diacylglycerol--serine O-phosphatidyltransferase
MRWSVVMNALALGNLFLGLAALFLAYHGLFEYSAMTILMAVFLDTVDNRTAKKLQTGIHFCRELDSLTDLITFGVVPAVLMYNTVLSQFHWVGVLVTAVFPIFGAFSLARFNTDAAGYGGNFRALPIAAAGGLVALMVLYHGYIQYATFPFVPPLVMIVLAMLMVNNREKSWVKKTDFMDH